MPVPYESRFRAGPEELDDTFAHIGEGLQTPATAYDIGGGPMVYRRIKDATKDVDLVVLGGHERDAIRDVLLANGYEIQAALPGYESMSGLILQRPGRVGVDLFVVRIMDKFHLSPTMRRRAEGPYTFGRLTIHHCANEDIFLLKTITNRPDDDDDVIALARTGLDEAILYEEARVQEGIAPNNWPWKIYESLEAIEQRKGISLPIKSGIVD